MNKNKSMYIQFRHQKYNSILNFGNANTKANIYVIDSQQFLP